MQCFRLHANIYIITVVFHLKDMFPNPEICPRPDLILMGSFSVGPLVLGFQTIVLKYFKSLNVYDHFFDTLV